MADHGFLSRIVADARKALPVLRMQRPPSADAEAPLVWPSAEAAPAAVSDVAADAGPRHAPVVPPPGVWSARQESNATVEAAAPQSPRRVEARPAAGVPYGRMPPPLPAAALAAGGGAAQGAGVAARAGQAPEASVESSPARPGEGPPSEFVRSVAAPTHGARGVPPPAPSSGPTTYRPQGDEVGSASGATPPPQDPATPPAGSALRMSRLDGRGHAALDAMQRIDATPAWPANLQVAPQRDVSAREQTPVSAAPAGVSELATPAPAPRPVAAARIGATPPPAPAAAAVAVAPDVPTRAAPAAAAPAPVPARIHIGRIDITVEAAPLPATRAPRDAAGPPADMSSRRYLRGL